MRGHCLIGFAWVACVREVYVQTAGGWQATELFLLLRSDPGLTSVTDSGQLLLAVWLENSMLLVKCPLLCTSYVTVVVFVVEKVANVPYVLARCQCLVWVALSQRYSRSLALWWLLFNWGQLLLSGSSSLSQLFILNSKLIAHLKQLQTLLLPQTIIWILHQKRKFTLQPVHFFHQLWRFLLFELRHLLVLFCLAQLPLSCYCGW